MDDEQQIRELVQTWMAATKAGDSATVLGLMTDDAQFLVPGLEPFGKAAFAEAARHQSEASMQIEGSNEILEIKVLGDWAYMLTRLRVSVTQSGQEQAMLRAGHTLSILRKEAGKWKIARDANLLVAS